MRIPPAERLLAVVGYVPFLFWIPIVGRRDSMFCQFHGRQSFVLWVLWLVPVVAATVTLFFVNHVAVFLVMAAASLLYLLMSAVGMLKAAIRERYRMPVVADVALYVFRM